MTNRELVEKLLIEQEGLLLTKQIGKNGITLEAVEALVADGFLRKLNHSLYLTEEACEDELFYVQAYGNTSVFSHETALQLHHLGEPNPMELVVTLPSGSSAVFLRSLSVKVHFMKKDLFGLGIIKVKTSEGRTINAYNQERTLCDLVRSRNEMPPEWIEEAFRRYMASEQKNVILLFEYARQFRIDGILKNYIEVK